MNNHVTNYQSKPRHGQREGAQIQPGENYWRGEARDDEDDRSRKYSGQGRPDHHHLEKHRPLPAYDCGQGKVTNREEAYTGQ